LLNLLQRGQAQPLEQSLMFYNLDHDLINPKGRPG
jgi:hypothetical protein